MTPHFLSLDEVLRIHRDQIERYGGSLGVRDIGLLESAIAMPRAGSGGEFYHADLFEMAAAYLFHVVKNHPFVDGNKRVGAMAAYTFMHMNDILLEAPETAFEKVTLSVADGGSTKADVAEFFRKHGHGPRALRRRNI